MNRLFRICTEYRNIDTIIRLIGEYGFSGATILQGIGIWKGTQEDALIVEIVGDASEGANVIALASAIKEHNHQEAVLVQGTVIDSVLV